jgi:hypothetical protein
VQLKEGTQLERFFFELLLVKSSRIYSVDEFTTILGAELIESLCFKCTDDPQYLQLGLTSK